MALTLSVYPPSTRPANGTTENTLSWLSHTIRNDADSYSGFENSISDMYGLFFSGGVNMTFLPKSTFLGSTTNLGWQPLQINSRLSSSMIP